MFAGSRPRRLAALESVSQWPGRAAAAVLDVRRGTDSDVGPVAVTGPHDRSFPWASVTKPATALCVLIACEEGTLALDEPAGPTGSTVRHLLAHASGLGPQPGPAVAAPGTKRVYSNVGYALLGELVATRSQMTFADYLRDGILGPLSMWDTTLVESVEGGAAAAGLVGPLDDLVRLGRELATPTLISEETHAMARSVAFAGLSGVLPGFGRFDPCDWGLGVEIRGHKHPHWTGTTNSPATYGHFGGSGALLWVDPVAGIGCAALSDQPFGPWATRAWPHLADAVLREVTGAAAGTVGEAAENENDSGT
jgi:CubicO group peptidase (beta-lactamase class C family)